MNSPDAWARAKKELLSYPVATRVNLLQAIQQMHYARSRNRWFGWAGVECFEVAKDVLGHEGLCVAMAEEPEWAKDVYDTETDVALAALDLTSKKAVGTAAGFIGMFGYLGRTTQALGFGWICTIMVIYLAARPAGKS